MKTFIIVAGIIFVLIIVSRVRRGFQKYKAALNCLMAKAMFAQANEDLKAAAAFRSWQVLRNMGFSDPVKSFEEMSEVNKCAVLAFAFAEMGIPPPFKKESWQFVSRPFLLILNADKAFWEAQRYLKTTYDVDIKF